MIKGGGGHVFVLDKTGNLYACGWNHKGQLGVGNQKDLSSFVQIHFDCFKNKPVSKVACGWDSSAAIDSDGVLYVMGSNTFGQLGFDKKAVTFSSCPIKLMLPLNEKVQDVCFGLRYICILTDQKNIYVAGRVKFSDQCDVIKHNGVEFFRLKTNSKDIRCVASGSNHLVYRCGSNEIIGVGDSKYDQSIERSFTENIVQLESGWTHNGVLTADGKVWLWGRNTYGQLGTEDSSSTDLVELKYQNVETFYLGSEHGMAVTKGGSVITWGWNEHGNCGNGNVQNM